MEPRLSSNGRWCMGRTPIIGVVIREFLPWQQYLTYIESIAASTNARAARQHTQGTHQILVRSLGLRSLRDKSRRFAFFATARRQSPTKSSSRAELLRSTRL